MFMARMFLEVGHPKQNWDLLKVASVAGAEWAHQALETRYNENKSQISVNMFLCIHAHSFTFTIVTLKPNTEKLIIITTRLMYQF